MRVLVVYSHPDDTSFNRAVARAAVTSLTQAGHEVDLIDLYAEAYQPAMTTAERRAYETDSPVLDDVVAAHARLVRRAEALVFVYPTWWSTLPAMLKGWMERTLVMGVAFELDERTRRVRPLLTGVRTIVGISTYGSPRRYVSVVNDNGRRTLTRALRGCTGWRTRTRWLGMYELDTSTPAEREAFLDRVRLTMKGLP
jgi:putative NADPH-quinone reductase